MKQAKQGLMILLLALVIFCPFAARAEIDKSEYPESLTGQRLFTGWAFSFSIYRTQYFSGRNEVVGRELEDNWLPEEYELIPDVDLEVVTFYPSGSIRLIDTVSLDLDFSMRAIRGDYSDFNFGHFGIGVNYNFFNVGPIALTTGIHFKLINQSFKNTFSPDIFYLRPYLASGIKIWRFSFGPYIGLPVNIDIDEDNDPNNYCRFGPDNDSATPGNIPDPNACYPRRTRDYYRDRNPLGIDYGVPIGFQIWGGLHLMVEPSGLSWLYRDRDTSLWVTPGLQYKGSMFVLGFGVQVRVYSDDPTYDNTEIWNLVVHGGVSF